MVTIETDGIIKRDKNSVLVYHIDLQPKDVIMSK